MPIGMCNKCRKFWVFDVLGGAEQCIHCRLPLRRATLTEACQEMAKRREPPAEEVGTHSETEGELQAIT